jgi:hypothetical protein
MLSRSFLCDRWSYGFGCFVNAYTRLFVRYLQFEITDSRLPEASVSKLSAKVGHKAVVIDAAATVGKKWQSELERSGTDVFS